MYLLPRNLHIIEDTDKTEIIEQVKTLTNGFLHATNGAYGAPLDVVWGTTVTGFRFLNDHIVGIQDAFMIAVNSDQSMNAAGKPTPETQIERAMKVALPVAATHQGRQVLVTFYDEQTPTELYNALADAEGITPATLHKWGGFGIGENAPVIEGAESFERVYAFPFYNKDKPAFWDDTKTGNQSDIVEVVDLHRTTKNEGKAYLDVNNRPLFLRPDTKPQDFFIPKP